MRAMLNLLAEELKQSQCVIESEGEQPVCKSGYLVSFKLRVWNIGIEGMEIISGSHP